MKRLKAIGAFLLAILMPKAFSEKDETLHPQERVPGGLLNFGGPEDNPYVGPGSSEYLRRQWDQENGWVDYR